jgi:uncharacterized membrane protein
VRGGALARNLDLLLTIAAAVGLVPVVALLPDGSVPRIAFVLGFVLLAPGHALVSALFPGRSDVRPLERLVLAAGLSLATMPLLALILNYSPWGVRTHAVAWATVALVLGSAGIALARRLSLGYEEAFALPPLPPVRSWASPAVWRTSGAALLVAVAIGIGSCVAVRQESGKARFTEFYMLGPTGAAAYYPREVAAGQDLAVPLGVVNHEGRPVMYRIEARLGETVLGSLRTPALADGGRWEGTMTIVLDRAGLGQRVEFLLHREGTAETTPYRRLQLTLDVHAVPVPVIGQ